MVVVGTTEVVEVVVVGGIAAIGGRRYTCKAFGTDG